MAFRLLLILVAGVALVTILTHYGSDESDRGQSGPVGGISGGINFASTAEGFSVPYPAYIDERAEQAPAVKGRVYAADTSFGGTPMPSPIHEGEDTEEEDDPKGIITPDQLLPKGDNPFGDSLGPQPDVMGISITDPRKSASTRVKGVPTHDLRGPVPLNPKVTMNPDGEKTDGFARHPTLFLNSPYADKSFCTSVEIARTPGSC